MTRLASAEKAQYYPTPPEVVASILGHLRADGPAFRLLDACCGGAETQLALDDLARGLPGARPFGIELDGIRAEWAERILGDRGRVLNADIGHARLPDAAHGGAQVQCVFSNPPYDKHERYGRMEYYVLKLHHDWLQPGGVLVFVVPQYILADRYLSAFLANHYDNLRVYRFPGKLYDAFNQVVIFAVKRTKRETADAAAEWLKAYGQAAKQEKQATLGLERPDGTPLLAQPPDLPDHSDDPYPIPALDASKRWFFKTSRPSEAEVDREAGLTGLLTSTAWAALMTTPRELEKANPLMNLRAGHISMFMAAGLLNNFCIERAGPNGLERLIVKGALRKHKIRLSSPQEEEKGVVREREELRALIVTLDRDTGRVDVKRDEASMRSWLTAWKDVLAAKIVESFQPVHDFTYTGTAALVPAITKSHSRFRKLPGRGDKTGLFEAQRQVVAALTRRYLAGGTYAIVQGTMGTGKTSIAASLADVLKKALSADKPFPVFVSCPPHLVEKWCREVEDIVPLSFARIITTCAELDLFVREVLSRDGKGLAVAVCSTEMWKRGSGWVPVARSGQIKEVQTVVGKKQNAEGKEEDDIIVEHFRLWHCPKCNGVIHRGPIHGPDDKEIVRAEDEPYLQKHQVRCENVLHKRKRRISADEWEYEPGHRCGEACWQEWRGRWAPRAAQPARWDGHRWVPDHPADHPLTCGDHPGLAYGRRGIFGFEDPKRSAYPIADYIKIKYPQFFELLVLDEAHEMKARDSDRGAKSAVLIAACKRTLALSGTTFGGFASSLFALLYRLDPRVRRDFTWRQMRLWSSLYGVLETTRWGKQDKSERIVSGEEDDEEGDEEAGVFTGVKRSKLRVVERPGVSPALILRLIDSTCFLTLPDLGLKLPDYQEIPVLFNMPTEYADKQHPLKEMRGCYRDMESALAADAKDNPRLLSTYLQETLAWPNAYWRSAPYAGRLPDAISPKEEWFIQKCLAERGRGRRVLAFFRQTGTRDITGDIQRKLETESLKRTGRKLRVEVLRSSVEPKRRERWVQAAVKRGVEVLLTNPKLVETGLDLVAFQTCVWYEISYSIYVVMQASKRLWRLGQTDDVEVYYLGWRQTMEEKALVHVQKKIVAAQILYGDDITASLVPPEKDATGTPTDDASSFLAELAQQVRQATRDTSVTDLTALFSREAVKEQTAGGWLTAGGTYLPDAEEHIIDAVLDKDLIVPQLRMDPREVSQLSLF